jgi:aminoglycoside/choline kinase family phosphotransferase
VERPAETQIDGDAAREWVAERCEQPLRGLDELPGGAGNRRYWRARLEDGSTAILMHALPEDPSILPPGLRSSTDELPFVSVSRLLARHGLPVPELLGVSEERRWVLLEDLGDCHLCDLNTDERRERYAEALEMLARVHAIEGEDALPFRRCFDEEWIRFELSLFVEQLPSGTLRDELADALGELARDIAQLPRVMCLRDYQSQNLMIDSRGRLRLLDYQDALLAPAELDLAALLHDSYVAMPEVVREEGLAHYVRCTGGELHRERFAMLTVQRKCKDFSRFRYVSEAKGDFRYEPYIESARAAILHELGGLPAEHAALKQLLPAALGEPVP